MAGRSLDVVDITEILVHWHAGRSQNEIAASLGVDRKMIRKYVAPVEADPPHPARADQNQRHNGAAGQGDQLAAEHALAGLRAYHEPGERDTDQETVAYEMPAAQWLRLRSKAGTGRFRALCQGQRDPDGEDRKQQPGQA
jgi:hypothetical protein